MKRGIEESCIANPFIKEENRHWQVNEPFSLTRSVSPPPKSSRRILSHSKPSTAQIEAGKQHVEDHAAFFLSKIFSYIRLDILDGPKLDHQSWAGLYTGSVSDPRGHHFVIHQHDHPVAGTHYDLRLQCNPTSSVSWAIMYGLPGDPNSRRLNRNATETRIHCLWNHLIETASHQTGTLLIWDTGRYSILPYHKDSASSSDIETNENGNENEEVVDNGPINWNSLSEPEKLHRSFQNRRIRLRLHGTRLPENYTLSMWLRRENHRSKQPVAPKVRRRKGAPNYSTSSLSRRISSNYVYDSDSAQEVDTSSDTEVAVTFHTKIRPGVSSLHRHESPPSHSKPKRSSTLTPTGPARPATPQQAATATTPQAQFKEEGGEEDEIIRQNNAYPGATNSINSIHQRRWYLALDRANSGFLKQNGRWTARSALRQQQNTEIETHVGTNTDTTRKTDSSARSLSSSSLRLESNVGCRNADIPLWSAAGTGNDRPTHGTTVNRNRTHTHTHTYDCSGEGSSHSDPQGFLPFYVLGRDCERSVVTGRLASDILDDEGVVGYVPRGKWRPVTE